jgi:hypothetical protein
MQGRFPEYNISECKDKVDNQCQESDKNQNNEIRSYAKANKK